MEVQELQRITKHLFNHIIRKNDYQNEDTLKKIRYFQKWLDQSYVGEIYEEVLESNGIDLDDKQCVEVRQFASDLIEIVLG